MRIGIATPGLWKLRDTIELLTGGTACRLPPYGIGVDAIAGWGHKPTAARARAIAKARCIPYVAFEDGFLRSVHPGSEDKPLSMVMDRTGIYYDSRQPSDLEAHVKRRASSSLPTGEIRDAMDLLRETRLSKYNNSTISDIAGLGLQATRSEDRVLVVDQTAGDASIVGAMANEEAFGLMLVAAVTENPGAEILVRIHPETMLGRKAGHFSNETLRQLAYAHPVIAKALQTNLLRLTPEPINPWALLEACSKVYCVSSQLGFEGLMARCDVHCFGMPFFGGWGITQDRGGVTFPIRTKVSLEAIFAALYFDYCNYICDDGSGIVSYYQTIDSLSRRCK